MSHSLWCWSMVLSGIVCLSLVSPGLTQPRQWSARSGAETGVLVELYTSEG